ncbi:MAG: putative Dihydrolipoyl dehydrogenase, component of pyruvate and 2-oxoglutarate dehydrogenase [Verrucomicrobiales bacterium]|nr:putative Dihydrolipoyl dehydrogenase, component of pyruvate and 2-oxoglutarate dehydrogenase [Verrucomicrobiales bacterium]
MNTNDGEKAHDYDFAVIGGGSAGYAAARTAAGLGLKTVVIDGAEELGGLCILRGCMPSKTLIHTANVALKTRNAAEFGVRAAFQGVDTAAVRRRKRELIGEFAGYRHGQLADGRFALLRGTAAFSGSHELRVTLRDGGEILNVTAKTVLIATGSVIAWPEVPGLAETGVWTSDTVLDAEEVPASFIVLGGGAIALEAAHYLEGIGRRVTVIQRSVHVLTGMDPDLAVVVESSFGKRMTLHTGTRLLRVERLPEGGGKRVVFEKDGAEHTAEAAEVLLALGRRAAVQGLDPGKAGVNCGRGYIVVSGTMQTSACHIFAAGDVCGQAEVVHVAIQQGELAARNAARLLRGDDSLEKMDYRLGLFGVFTEPQVASVGMNEAGAAASGRNWKAASYPFNDHGKSMVMGETEGFVKMIADTDTGEILGASVVGPEAVELIHEVCVAMHFHCTVTEFLKIPFYHPTLSEIWTYPAEDLL